MWILIGYGIVLGCVVVGFLLSHGNLAVLFQPYEFLIIFGAALGALVVSAGSDTKRVFAAAFGAFKGHHIEKKNYLEFLAFFYDMAQIARKEGFLALETHVDSPQDSAVFKKYPHLGADPRVMSFMCENIKLSTFVKMESNELGDLMEIEIDAILGEEEYPGEIITKIGDSLPGLGIVAAVLGVILTMSYVNESAEIIGHHVAVALVGTFAGILACYGFIGPLGSSLEHGVGQKANLYNVVKVCIANLVTGASPAVVVELGRRAVPPRFKPTIQEIEEFVAKGGA